MKLLISGYGRMGKAVEAAAILRNHTIVAKVDTSDEIVFSEIEKDTIVIDFSQPAVAADNIIKYLKNDLKVVVGTTGWYDRFEEVKKVCEASNGSLLYGTNMSIGMNVMFFLNKKLASVMQQFPDYSVSMEETHHIHKLDEPSGTAITLAESIIENSDNLDSWTLEKEYKNNELPIDAIRQGEVTGTHEVTFQSSIDKISLRHEAFNRRGFSEGAILAAEWLQNRNGIFTMQDLLF